MAAIDAGSNAIRIVIVRAKSPTEIYTLETERYPVRLGHNVFTHGRFDRKTISRAVEAFRHFRVLMDRYHVEEYRAVATSASREARNRRLLIERIRRKAGIRLEVIDGAEEARLVRSAVLAELGESASPRLVVDLGGGSLEVNQMRGGGVERSVNLPLGTVRLMETYGIRGAISEEKADGLRQHILAVLRTHFPRKPNLTGAIAVACGGNAEALARLAPGPLVHACPTLNLRLLKERLWDILGRDVPQRMRVFRVRTDRAEVMGIAALVFATLARWWRLDQILVPGVGVREGVVRDLVREHFAAGRTAPQEREAQAVLDAARSYAARLHYDAQHCEHVRHLVLSIFDQLWPLHHMGDDLRRVLALGAVLHDVGHLVSRKSHHKHGEYLVRHGHIPGLDGVRRQMVACLVRYHNKAQPSRDHKLYASLTPRKQRQVRALTAILRIADALDSDRKQTVQQVDVERRGREVCFRLRTTRASNATLWSAQRKAALFEKEFGVEAVFTRAQPRIKVA